MLGYDVSWAAFNIVEVMSSSKFTFKVRIFAFYGLCEAKYRSVVQKLSL